MKVRPARLEEHYLLGDMRDVSDSYTTAWKTVEELSSLIEHHLGDVDDYKQTARGLVLYGREERGDRPDSRHQPVIVLPGVGAVEAEELLEELGL